MQLQTSKVLLIGLFLSSTLFGSSMIINLNLGSSFPPSNFESAPSIMSNISFLSSDGPIIEGSVGYISGEAKSGNSNDIKAVPVLASIKYRLTLKSKIHPYIGVKGGLSFLNSAYDATGLTYALTTGLLFNLSHDTKLFFDITKFYIDTGDSAYLFEPLTINAGIGIAFGESHKRKRVFNKRRKRRKSKPARRPSPRGPRESRSY
jgi:hypothetical protein